MKNCDRIWGKNKKNQDDGQLVFPGLRVHVQNQRFGCSIRDSQGN